MKSMRRWYQERSQQAVRYDLPRIEVVARSAKSRGTKNSSPSTGGRKHFVVGETPVGGEEIVG